MKNVFEINDESTNIFIKYKNEILESLIDTTDIVKIQDFKGTVHAHKDNRSGCFYAFIDIKIGFKKRRKSIYID
jgi:hypothetical protein